MANPDLLILDEPCSGLDLPAREQFLRTVATVSYTHLDVYKRQGMYTANTMNCLTEALGMGLPGNGTIPAVYSERLRLAKLAGMQAVEVLKANLRPKDVMTREAFENAVALDMALGGSSNTALHLPAIAPVSYTHL